MRALVTAVLLAITATVAGAVEETDRAAIRGAIESQIEAFRRDDASSALRNPHYKNFLRLMIDSSGQLTIYPIGIRRVATAWGPSR